MGKRVIAFGLVSVPVKIYSATEDHDVSLHQVHDRDGGRIRYERRCEVCGKVVPYQHIDKAFEGAGPDEDQTVILTKEDLASLPAEKSDEIQVVQFVPSNQLDPIMFDRSYFLEPDSPSTKAYVLLRQTLHDTQRTAVVQYALRQKTRLGALRVRDNAILLQSLRWSDEVRAADFPSLTKEVALSKQERAMASTLVTTYESDFEPDRFTDDYQEQLRTLIEAKAEQGDTVDTEATFGRQEEEEAGGEVIDLMQALRASVEKNRGRASGGPTAERDKPTAEPKKKAPSRKTEKKRRAS